MKVNLREAIDLDMISIIKRFESLGWKQEDENLITKTGVEGLPKTHQAIIQFRPELLTYEYVDKEKEKGVTTTTVWIAGEVNFKANPKSKSYRNKIKAIIEEIERTGLKPFHDEDAHHRHFTQAHQKFGDGTYYLSFFINPDYPGGYWQNHVLS